MKENTSEKVKALFKLYLDGKANPAEERELFALIETSAEAAALFKSLSTKIWDEQQPSRDASVLAQQDLASIWTRIGHETVTPSGKQHTVWLKYAASLFLVCTAALGWYLNKKTVAPEQQELAMITRITGKGERVKLLLPDSSVVYLNAISKLSFPAGFGKSQKREIHLEGEAFFEVKHDVKRPFIVHSGNLQTRVLGTSFNIDAYPGSKVFSISVSSGKVGVSTSSAGKLKSLSLLTPGKQLVYNLGNRAYAVHEERAADFNSWTTNRFIFRNETLANILTRLERSYNVNFKVKNSSILSCRFNATFLNKNIKQIVEQIRTMSSDNIHYQFSTDKTTITLWGEACQ